MTDRMLIAVGLLLCALAAAEPACGQSWFQRAPKPSVETPKSVSTSSGSINAKAPRRGAESFDEPVDSIVDPSLTPEWKYDVRSDAFQGQRRAASKPVDRKAGIPVSTAELETRQQGNAATTPGRGGDSRVIAPIPQRRTPATGLAAKAVSSPDSGPRLPRLSHSGLKDSGLPVQQTTLSRPTGSGGQVAMPPNDQSATTNTQMDSFPPLPFPQDVPNAPLPSNPAQGLTFDSQLQLQPQPELQMHPQPQLSDRPHPEMGSANGGPWQPPAQTHPTNEVIAAPPVAVELPSAMEQPMFWWEADMKGAVLRNRPTLPMSLSESLQLAMTEAPELKILHSDWYIQTQETILQDAAFDWTTFVNTVWNRDANPVGSQLDGAARRLHSRTTQASAGLKRLDRSGGELKLSQQFGLKNSNSQFISPNDQGNSRIALSYELPLLRGFGEDYNTGSLRLAELDKDIAFDRMQSGIQDHLLATAQAYWTLVLSRGDFLQKVTSWTRANAIAQEMATRVEIDVTPATLDRAQSEVANRMAQSIQAEHDVINAQEVLLELIYASRYTEFTQYEVVTTTLPPHQPTPVDTESQADVAVQARAEVHQAIREIRQATIQQDLAANEVMPQLDLVLTGYSAGLRPNYGVGQSFNDQFTSNDPGAGIGVNFEIPYRNRAALARAEQRRIAVARMQREFEKIVGDVKQDVRQQAINRNKFAATLPQQGESLVRVRRLMNYSQTRRDFLADGVRVGDLYLNDLLQIQNRLQAAEYQYLQTQVSFAAADNALMRSVASLQTLAELPGSGTVPSSGLLHHSGSFGGNQTSTVIGP